MSLEIDFRFIVIPAQAGIQVCAVGADLRVRPRLDTRWSLPSTPIGGGYDETLVRLKARGINHPRRKP
jgi:hypothetical protein